MSITLVTAFFNIGRENFKAIPRTDDTYLKNFKFWARIQNRLVVYTDKYMAEKVKEIRNEYGVLNKTEIIVIDDIGLIEPEILNRMLEVEKDYWFNRIRILPNATSNIARYSYLMLLKTWFLADAAKRGLIEDTAAWIDFGFNHGGKLYTNPEEFAFKWEHDFSHKIHLFYYKKIDAKPAFEMVRRLCDSIMGCIYVLPGDMCQELWKLTKDAMLHLLAVGLYDDDQMLLLMAYRAKPESFEMHQSDWFLPLSEYSSQKLTMRRYGKRPWYKQVIIDTRIHLTKVKLAVRSAFITFIDLAYRE